MSAAPGSPCTMAMVDGDQPVWMTCMKQSDGSLVCE